MCHDNPKAEAFPKSGSQQKGVVERWPAWAGWAGSRIRRLAQKDAVCDDNDEEDEEHEDHIEQSLNRDHAIEARPYSDKID
ncbi:hypothetical protein Y032_1039g3469 [Ancylostoma ceylanicum]|uniref:Uncharacterized protein n=1 Tax=Ancylostoma ceylanicum TaxID=53326 RepID=A0A016W7D0_9BILA|nr:hypothetical protein Y032_1039g3469 [Ancylostoma ceylanicum]